jgi:hypothetical protein
VPCISFVGASAGLFQALLLVLAYIKLDVLEQSLANQRLSVWLARPRTFAFGRRPSTEEIGGGHPTFVSRTACYMSGRGCRVSGLARRSRCGIRSALWIGRAWYGRLIVRRATPRSWTARRPLFSNISTFARLKHSPCVVS